MCCKEEHCGGLSREEEGAGELRGCCRFPPGKVTILRGICAGFYRNCAAEGQDESSETGYPVDLMDLQ